MTEYDAIVIGAGQGGVPLAKELAGSGRKTALVERLFVGGSCVNFGCTPTKTLYHSARVAYLARRGADYGIRLAEPSTDMKAVRNRLRDIVREFREGTEKSLRETENLDLICGHARFVSRREVEVEGHGRLRAGEFFIDVGTRARIPDLAGLDDVEWLDNAKILELEELPKRLIVLGGGYIGLEFAQMYRRLGSEVVVVEPSERLLSREDDDVNEAVKDIFAEDGIEILLGKKAASVRGSVALELESGETVEGSHLLLSVGREPNTHDLGLDAAGVELDERGYVKADERLRTTAEGVYALGDVKGGPEFTHISYDDYRILRDNLLRKGDRTTTDRPVPYVLFIDPQLGRLGPTETQLREDGVEFKSLRLEASSISRAAEMGETRGFIKVAIAPDSGRLLSASCLCVEGGELLGVLQVAQMARMDCRKLKDAVLAHPTLTEALNSLFEKA
jgi:pyruvate/2-oxoglutarate dehydrogenase complex dihydrolipoamide dehydrogenase (E3) component